MSVRVHVGLLVEPGDQSVCPLQGHLVVVDAEEQEEPVARGHFVRARQRGRSRNGEWAKRRVCDGAGEQDIPLARSFVPGVVGDPGVYHVPGGNRTRI